MKNQGTEVLPNDKQSIRCVPVRPSVPGFLQQRLTQRPSLVCRISMLLVPTLLVLRFEVHQLSLQRCIQLVCLAFGRLRMLRLYGDIVRVSFASQSPAPRTDFNDVASSAFTTVVVSSLVLNLGFTMFSANCSWLTVMAPVSSCVKLEPQKVPFPVIHLRNGNCCLS